MAGRTDGWIDDYKAMVIDFSFYLFIVFSFFFLFRVNDLLFEYVSWTYALLGKGGKRQRKKERKTISDGSFCRKVCLDYFLINKMIKLP